MIKKTQKWFQLQMQRLREQGLQSRLNLFVKKIIKVLIQSFLSILNRYPRLRVTALIFVDALGCRSYLKKMLHSPPRAKSPSLSFREMQVFRDLQERIQLKKRS